MFKAVWERSAPEHLALLRGELATELAAVEEPPARLARLMSESDGAGAIATRAIAEAAGATSSSALATIASAVSEQVRAEVAAEPGVKEEIVDHVVGTMQKEYGTRLESRAIAHYEKEAATVVKDSNNRFWRRKLGSIGDIEVSLGGRIDGKNDEGRVIEVKNRLKRFMRPLPKYDVCQLQAYLFILDAREGELVEHLRQKERRTRSTRLPRDRAYWDRKIAPCLARFAYSIATFAHSEALQRDFLLRPDSDHRKRIVRDLMFDSPNTFETRGSL